MLLVQLVDFHFKQQLFGERHQETKARGGDSEGGGEESRRAREGKVTRHKGARRRRKKCMKRGEVSQEG